MKIDVVNNSKRNILFGMISMAVSVLLPFFSRTVLIYTLGELYTGLSSLFQSIFQMLNILELGFGTAIIYFLYEPIAKDEYETINAILNYYRTCYRKIGLAILSVGLLFIPFIPMLTQGKQLPDVNLYVIYILMLMNAVMGYFVFPQSKALLNAYQRNDISSKIALVLEIIKNLIQIVVLLIFKNYYIYIAVIPVCECCNDLLHYVVVKRKYPAKRCGAELESDFKNRIKDKVKALFAYKIGNVISNFADSIVIFVVLGLETVGIYSNYLYIITALFSILAVYYSAVTPGLGNYVVLENVELNYQRFKTMQFIQSWMIGWISICLICLFQPFIFVWIGEDWLLPYPLVIFIVLFFYVWKIQDIVTIYKEATGLWDKDKYRPLISAMVNLILNIILVQFIGLYGVVLSTIFVNIFIDLLWAPRSLFKYYFEEKTISYYGNIIYMFAITSIIGLLTFGICRIITISPLWDLIIKIVICIFVPNLMFIILNIRRVELKETKRYLQMFIRKFGHK